MELTKIVTNFRSFSPYWRIERPKKREIKRKKRLLLRVPITLSNTVNERDENHIMVNSKPRIAHSV